MEKLVKQASELRMLPDVAVKAIAIADNPDSKITDLVNIVAQDIKLTTSLLSFSNSTIFGSTQTVSSLQQAITRVGFRQTKNMIMASCIVSMMQQMSWNEIRVRDSLCKHSCLTGVISSHLNTLFGLGMQGEEFTAGLIHDVGRTLLAVSVPDKFDEFDPLDFSESDGLLEREATVIGTTHPEVGAWFLQRNHLPEELVMVARHHHVPNLSTKYKRLVTLTAIADEMANYYHREGLVAGFDCQNCEHLGLLEKLGADEARMELQEFGPAIISNSVAEVNQLLRQ
jgi:HD-like signal output (HDOD) protein